MPSLQSQHFVGVQTKIWTWEPKARSNLDRLDKFFRSTHPFASSSRAHRGQTRIYFDVLAPPRFSRRILTIRAENDQKWPGQKTWNIVFSGSSCRESPGSCYVSHAVYHILVMYPSKRQLIQAFQITLKFHQLFLSSRAM
jgi:hypothetical protein